MTFLDKVHSIGKKVSGLISKGLSFGKKVSQKVDTINGKVKTVASIASSVPFLPDDVKSALSKVSDISGKVDEGNKLLKKGMGSAAQLQSDVSNVSDLQSALKVGTRAFYEGKSAAKAGSGFARSTRDSIVKPRSADKVSRANSLQPVLPSGVKLAKRALANVGSAKAGRGISRPENDDFQKALLAAKTARSMMSRGKKK